MFLLGTTDARQANLTECFDYPSDGRMIEQQGHFIQNVSRPTVLSFLNSEVDRAAGQSKMHHGAMDMIYYARLRE